MQESREVSLVRIRTAGGRVVGAGFLVGERQVLTCAHVIVQALALPAISPDLPETMVILDFPLLAPHMRLAARVACWCPVKEDGSGDIAGLELLGDPPPGAEIVHFAPAEDVWEHPFRVFGFPAGYDDGVWATGHLLGRQATNWLLLEDVKTEGFPVTLGFSGGPIWDVQLQGVVGMVVAASRPTETMAQPKTAFVLPFDVLAATWPYLQPITQSRIFLSAAPADTAFAERLRADLQAQGIVVWDVQHGPVDTCTDAEERVRQAIRAAQAVLLVVSPQARTSRTVKEHLHLADLYHRRLILAWVGDDRDTRPAIAGWQDTVWVDAQSAPYETALKQIEVALSQKQPRIFESSEGGSEQASRNPYKGLHPFTSEDVGDFFGRERLVNDLVHDVADVLETTSPEGDSERCLTIIGASGSGKSSVVMAGLLPRLQQGALPKSGGWVYLEPMTPGKRPLEALTRILKPHFPDISSRALREELEDDATQGLHLLATQLARERSGKVVLLVDQFEELFTQTESEDERRRFLDLLLTAATTPSGPLLVLFTLRADFYDRPMQYTSLNRLIQAHQRQVLPMDAEDLRATIEKPAALPEVKLTFEGNLVGDLLFEVQGQIGVLPLLQFALDLLFERRDGHRLTLSAYHKMGGVKGALSQHAEQTYTALPSEEHRHLARTLFLRLIEPGISAQETTRRRAELSEFDFNDPTQTRLMRETIDAFVAARLLTISTVAGTMMLEVSHETVLREWKRVGEWLLGAREDIFIQQDLSKDATQWEQQGKPRGRLYRGPQLKDVLEWARRNSPSKQEAAFIHASVARRAQVCVSWIVAALLLLCLVVTAGGYFAYIQVIHPDPKHVTTLQDNVPGSLRYCIENAPPGSTITFDPDLHGTISLRESLGFLSGERLTLQGPGAGKITIKGGNNTYANVLVPPGATLTISGLNFKDSKAVIVSFLANKGTLNLSNDVISGNQTSANTTSVGGGIYNTGTLTIRNSTISNNSSIGDEHGEGGGIYNTGKLIVSDSTISNNTASSSSNGIGDGGGIYSNHGMVTVVNSTLSGNTANSSSGDSKGGGIYDEGKLAVSDSTISGNKASSRSNGTGHGGGIYSNGQATTRDSIIADDHAQSGPDISGALTSKGYNLLTNMTGVTGKSTGDRQVTSASLKLDPVLRNNGGSTQTLKLLSGSQAIDAIPGNVCNIPFTDASGHPETITKDQRGSPRLEQIKGCL